MKNNDVFLFSNLINGRSGQLLKPDKKCDSPAWSNYL